MGANFPAMNALIKKDGPGLIAVVDDDQSVCAALESLLKSFGFRTAIFTSARNFLHSPQFPNVSCVVLDVWMPDMGGLELQQHLVASRPIPIIFVTAHRDEKTREQALRAGAIGFLNKPFSEEALIDALNSALGA
jgi:FixJ family two-component response regulator